MRFITNHKNSSDYTRIWSVKTMQLQIWPSGLGNYTVYQKFAVQTSCAHQNLWSMMNLQHNTSKVWNFDRSWSILNIVRPLLYVTICEGTKVLPNLMKICCRINDLPSRSWKYNCLYYTLGKMQKPKTIRYVSTHVFWGDYSNK